MGVVLQDWRTELTEILPHFFAPAPKLGEIAPARPSCPIECGPGWAAVVDRLCVRIAAALQDRERFRFESIRERHGALRISWGGRLSAASEEAVREAVDLAEARSVCVCELCGARGRLFQAEQVLMTRCVGHAQGSPAIRPDMENVHLTQRTIAGRIRVVVTCRYDFDFDSFVDADAVPSGSREA